jgi:hypothetical protein
MSKLIFSNPLIRRYRSSLLRPSILWIYLTIYASVVILLLFVNSISSRLEAGSVEAGELSRRLFAQFLVMEMIILWGWTTFNSATALKSEVLNRTYDFFRLLPLSALQKACGILLGRNLLALLFAAISLVFLLLFGLVGQIDWFTGVQIVFLLLTMALFTNSVFLLSFNTTSRTQAKTSTTLWILALIIAGPMLLGPLFTLVGAVSKLHRAGGYSVPFYRLEVPMVVLMWVVYV